MSRARYGLLLVVLAMTVSAAAFIGMAIFIGDPPIHPPGTTTGTTVTTAPASSTTSTTVPGGLSTPTFVVVVQSSPNESDAQATRDALTEGGYDSGVLSSDDYPSLEAGFWVAYTGPYVTAAAADADKAQLVDDGYEAAYSRCVGTKDECKKK